MSKIIAIAAVLALSVAATPALAQQKKAGGDNTAKCRALVRNTMPDYASPSRKREAAVLFQKCMLNGGKL